MAVTKFRSRVSERSDFNEKFAGVKLELIEPNRIEFKAGQYVILDVPGIEAKRSYSIASMPGNNHGVELVFDRGIDGPGTKYLEGLEPGNEVKFMAPAGKFVVAENGKEEELVFVATGSGITPIKSMINDLLITKRETRPIQLHWGLRYAEDLFGEEEWHQLDREYENFSVDIVLSRPPIPEWKLCSGRVTDCVANHRSDFSRSGFYLCGSREMIEEMKALLEEKGVEREMVHHELFY